MSDIFHCRTIADYRLLRCNAGMIEDPGVFLRSLYDTAVDAANPARCLLQHIPAPPRGRTVVVGAGKAAAAMAQALERQFGGELSGTVVVPYGHGCACERIRVIEAAHPVPDSAAEDAAHTMLEAIRNLTADDMVIALMSGGGSALMALPAPGISLQDKQAVTNALLASGAPIREINTVRRSLSAIKGGRLAVAAHPARVVTLAISDVPGDDPSVIASGPTVIPPADARSPSDIVACYGLDLSPAVISALKTTSPSFEPEGFARDSVTVVARAADSLEAAADAARKAGCRAIVLGDAIEGEARDVADDHARQALEAARFRKPGDPPVVLLSGGELTVTLRGGLRSGGKGGPNTEYLLALGLALNRDPRIWALAADTDGIDGASGAAGAVLTPWTVSGASDLGLDPTGMFAAHRSADLFGALDQLIHREPTLTNVNDFRATLIGIGDPAKVDL